MRMRLVGWAGDRPPVPETEPVLPIDPNPPPPIDPTVPDPMVVVLTDGVDFVKVDYQELGYSRFDVICIGGAGGRGGGYDQTSPVTLHHPVTGATTVIDSIRKIYGGGGGGGGLHRIKGRLALLPASCPVVVGLAGADAEFITETVAGYDSLSDPDGPDPPDVSPGDDGGVSSFNGITCRASGGKGGGFWAFGIEPRMGGDGGVGNSGVAGGGANGADSGEPGADGTWNGIIGKGGGGGWGGSWKNDGLFPDAFTAYPGGDGSVQESTPTTTGPGGAVGAVVTGYSRVQEHFDGAVDANYWDVLFNYLSADLIPGAGGGAKTFALNGDTSWFGSKAEDLAGDGIVIIRLT